MFSIADMAVAGAVALLLFGPDQLPKVARRAGQLVRDVQNTSQSFIREMERAADAADEVHPASPPADPPAIVAAGALPAAPAYHETPEPAAHDLVAHEAAIGPHSAEAEVGKHEHSDLPPGQAAP
ncbi:MAG: twin-arginine translocase TatA/TatE family subunit [Candidatus Velthaea sp.]|jgi:Sec-independent protein translocase protein TatA